MDRNSLKNIAVSLGISTPWYIKSFAVNHNTKTIDIHLELQEQKTLFGFGEKSRQNDSNLFEGSWLYMPIGRYGTIIHAKVPDSLLQTKPGVNRPLIAHSAFLGSPSTHYSNFLRQQMALAQIKGVHPSVIATTLGVTKGVLDNILNDLTHTSPQLRALTYLPTELDSVWEAILNGKSKLKTNVLPLKLLLSNLQKRLDKSHTEDSMTECIAQIRKFFIENASLLEREIDYVSGISTQKEQQKAKAVKSKLRLVLPTIKSGVWLDILSGKLSLKSASVPLNLLISNQRANFLSAKSTDAKVKTIATLRDYFKQNYRQLKAELLLLNRAMQIQNKPKLSLPNSDHVIWQKILENHDFIKSDNVAYRLLLSKLNEQLAKSKNPNLKMEAAKKVRAFLTQNEKSMRKEVNVVVKQSAAC